MMFFFFDEGSKKGVDTKEYADRGAGVRVVKLYEASCERTRWTSPEPLPHPQSRPESAPVYQNPILKTPVKCPDFPFSKKCAKKVQIAKIRH
jgi:hypothetical protein